MGFPIFPEVREVQRPTKLNKLQRVGGRCVAALDASGWHHRLGKAVDPVGYVVRDDYAATIAAFLQRLRRLYGLGIETLVVFDGEPAAAKTKEDEERRKAREEAQAKVQALVAAVV